MVFVRNHIVKFARKQVYLMAVYRFRVAFEDQEDTVREIEILGKQSYENFHRAIQEAIGFDNSKDASFFMSDDFWRKGQELTTRKLFDEDDDEDDFRRQKKAKVMKMSETKIADYIDDPHQKMVYVFDPAAKWTLLIELIRILADDPKASYPRTVKSSGAAPKQYKVTLAPPVDENDDEEDEEDKKAREKLFVAEEGYDEDAAEGAEEDKTDDAEVPGADAEGAEGEGEEGATEEYGSDESEREDF